MYTKKPIVLVNNINEKEIESIKKEKLTFML